jgi:uncharacterized protein YwqG
VAEHTAQLCRVEAWPELTLPIELPEISDESPAYEAYIELLQEMDGICGRNIHRLLGHPQSAQGDMDRECQLASNGINCGSGLHFDDENVKALEPGEVDWRLLLQIDTDEEGPGWMWGDVGRIYFWVKKQDLTALRFDDAWLILQCG